MIKNITILMFILVFLGCAQQQSSIVIKLVKGEKIWSGTITDGQKMPLKDQYTFNFFNNNQGNQIQPLLLSNKGLYIWSEEPFKFQLQHNQIRITENFGKIIFGRNGSSLAEARQYASAHFFPPSGEMPDSLLFSRSQYNTWIELNYNQNQKDILKYAHAIIDNGFSTGVFMIDDTWQEDYGKWTFHPGRFPDPKAMIDELHHLGFKVMLWVCPFVSPDQTMIVGEIMKGKGFLMHKNSPGTTWENSTEPAMIPWWGGQSAVLDFTNEAAVQWFKRQIDHLTSQYGIDGFKFDAGDPNFYPIEAISKKPVTPNEQSWLYAQIGLNYSLNEYRACWKMAGQPLGQRLRDKSHSWEDLQLLIPQMITEGLAGYTFCCPDMIGGGDYNSFINRSNYDEELVVRSAQCGALMPMMQFSVAPWRILNNDNLEAVKRAVELRKKFEPLLIRLAKASAKTGEPIVTNLEYYFPNQGFENVKDQFMLGNSIMVAPMLHKGSKRDVVLPFGQWKDDQGNLLSGGKSYQIDVPIERIPYYQKLN